MLRHLAGFIGFWLPCAVFPQTAQVQAPVVQTAPVRAPPVQTPFALHASYETYAAGMHVAEVETGFSFGPWTYQMSLGYHTIGVVGFFFRGHQYDRVEGTWQGPDAVPSAFIGRGEWRGRQRLAEIAYNQGKPVVHQLVPPNADEREPVPASLQTNSIDTLSALAQLIHVVAETGRCDTTVRTYDGRRAVEIDARTVGVEMLEASSRSSFAGRTLRCDFSGRMLSGFKFGDDREHDSKPLHGSAWLAPVVAGGSPLPVRMAFETRWFGEAVMYLTGIAAGSGPQVMRGD